MNTARRGIAMLLVLIVLVVAVAASANVARVAVTSKSAESISASRQICDDLLAQLERAAFSWLIHESHRAIVPPERATPSIPVLNDRIAAEPTAIHVTVTAYDLQGMVPASALFKCSELGAALPTDVIEAIEMLEGFPPPLGPDQLAATPGGRSVFPDPMETVEIEFGEVGPAWGADHEPDTHADRFPAIAEFVALTRHASPRNGPPAVDGRPIVLNVNTASIPVLDRAFASAGIEGLEQIIAKRDEGELATLDLHAGHETTIRFVTRSMLWAFRSEARVGPVRRAWWSVFEHRAGMWRLVQRIPIDI